LRALIFRDDMPRLVTDHPEPTLAPGEAIIRPLVAGVCSTDLELCRGYMGYEGVLGHEFVGVVEQVHPETRNDEAWVGQRVVGSINCICGKCDMCRGGLGNHCRDRTVLGIQNRDGCFAERFALPAANLLTVPEHVDDEQAVFTEPLAAGCQAKHAVTIDGKPYITVLGDGRLGLLTAQVMARLNASVRVIGKHPEKLDLCERWGIQHRLLDDVGLRADQDIVVDCTGSADGLRVAMQMVRPRGTIVLKTTVANQKDVDLSPLVIHEIALVGSRCGPFPEALSLLEAGDVDVVSLISKRVRFERAEDAIRAADQRGVLKVLIDFR